LAIGTMFNAGFYLRTLIRRFAWRYVYGRHSAYTKLCSAWTTS